eukprot:4037835-Prymnesium_polylepis.1
MLHVVVGHAKLAEVRRLAHGSRVVVVFAHPLGDKPTLPLKRIVRRPVLWVHVKAEHIDAAELPVADELDALPRRTQGHKANDGSTHNAQARRAHTARGGAEET